MYLVIRPGFFFFVIKDRKTWGDVREKEWNIVVGPTSARFLQRTREGTKGYERERRETERQRGWLLLEQGQDEVLHCEWLRRTLHRRQFLIPLRRRGEEEEDW